jgi:hypothetical protein
MVSVTQQMLQQQRKERAIASAQQRQSVPTPTWQEYDQSTTEGQIYSTRQQIRQARTPLEQFRREQLYPKTRARAFTARKDRAALVQTGRQVEAQLGEVAGQEQTFEREVATKAPEYATQVYKQQAIQEARNAIQSRVNDLNARIKDRQLQIQRYEERERNERGYDAGDTIDDLKNDIDEYRAELREYQSGLGADENTLIKQHFSGYLQQKADYESNYARQRNRQQADFRKYKQTEDFKKLAADLKLPANASLSQFEQSVSKFNQDVAYKNQLLKFAEQKGGVQFLNAAQQKALGVDTQGFDYYKTPQKGWVDPNTGRLIEMSIKEDYAKNMGYLPVEVQAFNRKTGEYISSSQSSLLTQQQKRMYDLFQESPKAASVFGFNINQSTKLPTEFVLKGSTQPMEYQKQIPSLLKKPSASGGAYEAATRMSPFTKAEGEMIEYKKDPVEFYKKYGYELTDEGQKIWAGTASPIIITKGPGSWGSALNLAGIAVLPKAVATFGAKKVASFVFSDFIKKPLDEAYSRTYQPSSFGGQFVKASLSSYLIMRSPTLATAYASSLLKSVAKDPKGTGLAIYEAARSRPGETLGFAVGGALIKRGLGYVEYKLRGGVPTQKINLPGYGEVVVQKVPKYGDVVWIKGAFAASEKVKIMTQINALLGKGKRVFVQVSPQGIATQVFSSSKNLGFSVKQLQNPMRGLYQAPPWQFLKKYNQLLKTDTGAASYYADALRRDSILPNPLSALKSLLTKDRFTNQRPFQYLERTGKGVQTPKWIQSVAKAMKDNKPLPKAYSGMINKWFKAFLEKPIEFNGKTYVGLEKLKLVNSMNLRGKGSGVKLKVYAALLEYQNVNKVRLVGGPEVLSGVAPFGPESQTVLAIGTKVFEKSAKDLRVGVKPSVMSRVIEFITGTKRGQYVSRIDGSLVEIQPIRTFAGRVSRAVGKLKKVTPKEAVKFDHYISKASNIKLPGLVDLGRGKIGIKGIWNYINYYQGRVDVAPPRPVIVGRKQETRRQDTARRDLNRVFNLTPVVRRPENRRQESRRLLDRVFSTSRRPELRKPETRRPDVRRPELRRPQDPIIRRPEPRRPDRPIVRRPEPQQPKLIVPPREEKQRRPQAWQPIRRSINSLMMPTITQQVYRVRRKGGRLKRATGFEWARF